MSVMSARFLRGPFAGFLGALVLAGPFVACNDSAQPVSGCAALSAKTSASDATVKAYADAAARLYVAAYQVDQQFLSICNGVMRDVQPTFEAATKSEVACSALAVYLQTDLAKGISIAFDVEGGCALDLTTEARCEEDCASGASCDLSSRCEAGQLVTECSGECTGPCDVRNPTSATICSGLCAGLCGAPSSGTCAGRCDGSCDSTTWSGICDGGCTAGFDGSCASACVGTCDGTATPTAGVQCPGHCLGSCDKNASGKCGARCLLPRVTTDRFHGTCAGTCTGTCARSLATVCNGACYGTCYNPTSTARCVGTCHGSCDTADAPVRCLGKLDCSIDANCTAGCVASGFADSNCTGLARYVISGDAILWSALNSRAAAIATAVLATKALAPHIADVFGTIGPAVGGGTFSDAAKICYSESVPVAKLASDTIAFSTRNSAIVTGAP